MIRNTRKAVNYDVSTNTNTSPHTILILCNYFFCIPLYSHVFNPVVSVQILLPSFRSPTSCLAWLRQQSLTWHLPRHVRHSRTSFSARTSYNTCTRRCKHSVQSECKQHFGAWSPCTARTPGHFSSLFVRRPSMGLTIKEFHYIFERPTTTPPKIRPVLLSYHHNNVILYRRFG